MSDLKDLSDDQLLNFLLEPQSGDYVWEDQLRNELFRRLTEARTEIERLREQTLCFQQIAHDTIEQKEDVADGLREFVALEMELCYNCQGGLGPLRTNGTIQPCEYCARRQAALDASEEKGKDDERRT